MTNKYVLVLGCAFAPSTQQVTAFGQERQLQYIEGFNRIFELSKVFPEFDFILMDNTIPEGWQMPAELAEAVDQLPNLRKVMFYENELAAKNKGCGVMAGWKKLVQEKLLEPYEYLVYFEPRQRLLDYSFFDRFRAKPANYFKLHKYRVTAQARGWFVRWLFKLLPIYKTQISNGLFSLTPKEFAEYVNGADIVAMANNQTSLEDDMYDALKHVPYIKVDRLGFVWHNAFLNKDFEF